MKSLGAEDGARTVNLAEIEEGTEGIHLVIKVKGE